MSHECAPIRWTMVRRGAWRRGWAVDVSAADSALESKLPPPPPPCPTSGPSFLHAAFFIQLPRNNQNKSQDSAFPAHHSKCPARPSREGPSCSSFPSELERLSAGLDLTLRPSSSRGAQPSMRGHPPSRTRPHRLAGLPCRQRVRLSRGQLHTCGFALLPDGGVRGTQQ